jgi:hypothetical protein
MTGTALKAMPDLVLHVGSRGGGYAALLFFSVIFATLGGVVAWEYRKQRPGGPGPAVLAGVAVFLGPLMLVYYSSLNGFYEAELSPTHLELRYLPPFSGERVAWSEISRAEARPVYRGSWRVHLVLASGGELESAASNRDSIEAATRRLQAQISIAGQPE